MSQQQGFSSRLTMMLAMVSMAVGTGNIWRFPRIAATNGGGEFLVAWAICLVTWSIPLILIELGMGRLTRRGSVGAFVITLLCSDGMVQISQISEDRVERVSDKLKEGDVVRVKVLEVDRQGRIRLSMRSV